MMPIPAAADDEPSKPLTETGPPAVPAVAMTTQQRTTELSEAAVREKVVEEDANRTWRGVPMKPWSEERQRLLDRLQAADIPLPDTEACDDVTFYHGMFGWAVKALYLALHEPREWEPLRPRLMAHIEAWGAAENADEPGTLNVPGDSLSEKAEAVNLVVAMVNAHRKVMAQRRILRRTRGAANEGN